MKNTKIISSACFCLLQEDGKQDFADDEASRKLASDSNTLLRNQQAALNR